jgi:ribosomal protein L32E
MWGIIRAKRERDSGTKPKSFRSILDSALSFVGNPNWRRRPTTRNSLRSRVQSEAVPVLIDFSLQEIVEMCLPATASDLQVSDAAV